MMKKIKFIEPDKILIGRIFRLFGIEFNTNFIEGYFHQFGYSGMQKHDNFDIVIIEKLNGCVITIPNKKNISNLQMIIHTMDILKILKQL